MNRKKGFISIIALITMVILLSISLYLVNISKLEHLILSAGNNKNKSYYQSEGKIHLALYDDKYYLNQVYMNIIDVFRTNNFATLSKKVIIEDEDLDYGDDIKDIWLKFSDKNNRIFMDIIANSNVNGVESIVTSSGPVVNEFFEKSNPIINLNLIKESDKEKVNTLLKTINENISIHNCYKNESVFGIELENFNKSILNKKNNGNYEIASIRNKMTNPCVTNFAQKEVFIIAKSIKSKELDFFIGDPGEDGNHIKLSGILFIEGNLIITSDFYFKGIIIVQNGKIINESMKEFKVEGLVIIDEVEDQDIFIKEDDMFYSRHYIYKYGTYLPGFLDPKITVIKGI